MDRTSGLALDQAVTEGSMNVVQMILDHGAHPQYSRALHGVIKWLHENPSPEAQEGWRPFIEKLLRYGAEINAVTWMGGTALTRAIRNKNREINEFLIERGANPKIKTPAMGKDSFDSAMKFEEQPWERTEEVKDYLQHLTSSSTLEDYPPAPEEAIQNPLVQIIEEMRREQGARAAVQANFAKRPSLPK